MKISKLIPVTMILLLFAYSSCEIDEDGNDPTNPIGKFLGTWKVNETCNRLNYSVEILADPTNSAQVLIYNFGNPGPGYNPAIGLVVSNAVYISSQTIGEGWQVSGNGTYQSNGSMSWVYTLIIGSDQYNCSATFTK